eukprot:Pgem_evm1s11437
MSIVEDHDGTKKVQDENFENNVKESLEIVDISAKSKDEINLQDEFNDAENFSNISKYDQTKPPLKESIKKIPKKAKKFAKKCWKGIPKEFFSWKRWLGFVLTVAIAYTIFYFIPLNTNNLPPGVVPHWYSMTPPLLAIAFSVFFKQVLLALGLGIFVGGMIAFKGNVYHVFVYLIFHNIWDAFQAYVVGFTLCLVGMVYVMHKSGGLDGMCDGLMHFARSTYSTRIVTAFSGIVFFFDDYGNTVVVGSTFKGLASRMQISSEKLAYIVDSTAAPVAGVAIISTWIGAEVDYFNDVGKYVYQTLNTTNTTKIFNDPTYQATPLNGYTMFLNALPYRFYCYTALFLDFGPMLEAEKRALIEGKIQADDARVAPDLSAKNNPDSDIPKRMSYAIIPLLVVVLGSLFGMFWDGRAAVEAAGESLDVFNGEAWRLALGSCDSAKVLFYSALAGTIFAFLMPMYGQTITFDQATKSFLTTVPSMYEAVILLYLSWGVKSACDALHTSDYLVAILGDIPFQIIPLVTFLMASITAVAIGSSWSTMGILLPIMMQLAWDVAFINGETDASNSETGLNNVGEQIFYLTGAAVLDGAIFGDHCSPISDTTVLSTVTTSCDLIAHVRTQLPYALVGGIIASAFGYTCVAFGMPFWLFYPVSIICGVLVFFVFGAKLPKASDFEQNPNLKAEAVICRSAFMELVHKISG